MSNQKTKLTNQTSEHTQKDNTGSAKHQNLLTQKHSATVANNSRPDPMTRQRTQQSTANCAAQTFRAHTCQNEQQIQNKTQQATTLTPKRHPAAKNVHDLVTQAARTIPCLWNTKHKFYFQHPTIKEESTQRKPDGIYNATISRKTNMNLKQMFNQQPRIPNAKRNHDLHNKLYLRLSVPRCQMCPNRSPRNK